MHGSNVAACSKDAAWWKVRILSLQRGRLAQPPHEGPGYEQSWVELREAALELAHKRFSSFCRALGDAEFEDVLRDGLDGAGNREGILTSLAAMPAPPETPRNWFVRCLRNRLNDAVEGTVKLESLDARPSDGTPREVTRGLYSSDQELALAAVPRSARRTLQDAHEIVAVVLELLPRLPAGHPLAPLSAQAAALADGAGLWHSLAGYLDRDLGLWPRRRPWAYGDKSVETKDNHERAWMAEYLKAEEATALLGKDEIPADKHGKAGQLFYQHKKRFKDAFQAAAAAARAAVAGADRRARELARGPAARERIPVEWDAAEHETLQ